MVLDLYCERLSGGFFAEPLNAASNVAFILAAWFVWRGAGTRQDGRLLALMLGAIGVGSGLFHTYATGWAQWLDVGPIVVFQLSYLWLYLRHCARVGAARAGLLLGAYTVCVAIGACFPHVLNGSLGYLPAAAALILIGIFHHRVRLPASTPLLSAGALFLGSLVLRTADNAVCIHWPLGTHWLWHVLNGLVSYLLCHVYLRSSKS